MAAVGQRLPELAAGGDIELGEDLGHVVLDGAGAEPLALMNLAALDLDKAREFFALRYFGALAVELAPIRVNAVCPGVVRSPLWASMSKTSREQLYHVTAAAIPAGCLGRGGGAARVSC